MSTRISFGQSGATLRVKCSSICAYASPAKPALGPLCFPPGLSFPFSPPLCGCQVGRSECAQSRRCIKARYEWNGRQRDVALVGTRALHAVRVPNVVPKRERPQVSPHLSRNRHEWERAAAFGATCGTAACDANSAAEAGRQAGRALAPSPQAQAHLIEMVKCMLASRSVDLAMWTEVVVRLSQARLESTPL